MRVSSGEVAQSSDANRWANSVTAAYTIYKDGTTIRAKFKHMVIVDENMIVANVHPNCRCYLTRLYPVEEPE